MKKPLNKNAIINIGFYGGLAIKGIDALIEFIGGFLLRIVSNGWITRTIQTFALPELQQDPNDILMNHFIKFGQDFSMSKQYSVAVYLMLHGAIKLAVIYPLWKKKLWAYPFAVVAFGVFIAYEIYTYSHNHSVLLLGLIILDIIMILMIFLEFNSLNVKKPIGSKE